MNKSIGVLTGWIKKYPLLFVSLAALPFFLMNLGAPALNDGEAMYAEIAREMRESGDWITPHLNGTRHFDKPPLLYWLVALAQIILGEGEVSARIWQALAAWGTIPIVGAIGGTLFGRSAGWIGALVYASTVGPFIFGRMALPDPSMTFCISLAVLGYVKWYSKGIKSNTPWFWMIFVGTGLAALIKGILGMGLPVAIIGSHVIISGRTRAFLSRRFLAGLAILAAIVLPWNAAVAMANPEFIGYFIIREHILRFSGKRYPPDEFLSLPVFLALTLTWVFPWVALVPHVVAQGIRQAFQSIKDNSAQLLLILWIGIIVGLFSASRSRLEYYAYSSLPAFSILIGKFWADAFQGKISLSSARTLRVAFSFLAVAAMFFSVLAFIAMGPAKDWIFSSITRYWPGSGWVSGPEQMAALDRIRFPSLATMVGIALFSLGTIVALRRSLMKVAFGLSVLMMVPIFVMVHWGFLVMEPFMSSRQIAEIVQRNTRPGDIVVSYEPHEYMWIGGLTFYTGHPVYILKDPKFEGVTSRRREPAERFLDQEDLLKIWGAGKRVVLVFEGENPILSRLSSVKPFQVLGTCGGKTVLAPAPNDTGPTGGG